MSAAEQIMDFMGTRTGEHSTSAISNACEAPQTAVYTALGELVRDGRLVRVRTGYYCLPSDAAANGAGSAPKPAAPIPSPAFNWMLKPEPDQTEIPAFVDTLSAPHDDVAALDGPAEEEAASTHDAAEEPLRYSVWDDDDLVVLRGDIQLVISAAERADLVAWMRRRGLLEGEQR